jgi:predicted small lipoprotein YifL
VTARAVRSLPDRAARNVPAAVGCALCTGHLFILAARSGSAAMPTMSRFHRALPVIPLLVVALLAGCGRKGPLYLPPPPAASTAPLEQDAPKPVEDAPKQAPTDSAR